MFYEKVIAMLYKMFSSVDCNINNMTGTYRIKDGTTKSEPKIIV